MRISRFGVSCLFLADMRGQRQKTGYLLMCDPCSWDARFHHWSWRRTKSGDHWVWSIERDSDHRIIENWSVVWNIILFFHMLGIIIPAYPSWLIGSKELPTLSSPTHNDALQVIENHYTLWQEQLVSMKMRQLQMMHDDMAIARSGRNKSSKIHTVPQFTYFNFIRIHLDPLKSIKNKIWFG